MRGRPLAGRVNAGQGAGIGGTHHGRSAQWSSKPVDGVLGRRRADRPPGAGFLACLPGRLAAVRGVQRFEFVQESL